MEVPSPISDSLRDSIVLSPLNNHHARRLGENERFSQFMTKRHLEKLDLSVLQQLSKDVCEALILSKKRKQDALLRHEQNKAPELQELGRLRCEYSECNRTFRHNKDRLRHTRQYHSTDARKFVCPVVDCNLGFRHTYTRVDKLRAHLGGKKISALQWACFLPGCSEIAVNRAYLYDHIQKHNYVDRSHSRILLMDYGFAVPWNDYLFAMYTCNIPGCPFGTSFERAMSEHLSIPHDGPFCPCPIPSCREVLGDFQSAQIHLYQTHDFDTRQRFANEVESQNLGSDGTYFVCPVCHHEITGYRLSVEVHCKKHTLEQFLKVSEALLTAWKFAFGSRYTIPLHSGRCRPNIDGLLAYLTLSGKDLRKLSNQVLLEEAGERLRASLEVPNIKRGLMDASMEPALSGNDQAGQNSGNFTGFVNESGILPDRGFLAPAETESSNY